MSKCCLNHYSLCSIPMCEIATINLPIKAELTGEYTFLLHYLDAVIEDSEIFSVGDDISFSLPLNEDYAYTLEVYSPTKELVSFVIDGEEYNGFVFCTLPKIKVC